MSLSIKNLNVELGGKAVLKNVNLEIAQGEFFSLLGSSGCGKSTLLKTVAGLVQERDGEIWFGERCLHTLPPQKRGTVIMFQDQRLFTNMTVSENVSFALRNKGVRKPERERAAKRYLEMVQLPGFGDRRVSQMSGGQLQRVALARALAAEPSVLMLDEPFSALDENLRDDMRTLVRRIHDETGITTIMVTHDQREALALSDRIAVMEQGEVLQTGTPEEVYEHPATLAIAEYFTDGDHVGGTIEGGVFRSGDIVLQADLPDGDAIAVVRKSAVSLGGGGIEMKVDALQYHGECLLVMLVSKDIELHCELPTGTAIEPGDVCEVQLDSSKILLFARS